MRSKDQSKDQVVQQLASWHLGFHTLEVQNSYRLDFHDVGVRGVKDALEAAYDAGYDACKKEKLEMQRSKVT